MLAALIGSLIGALAPDVAATAPPTRVEIPIKAVVLSNKTRRYSVPITVGATAIEAGLDTGSSGLRVLPGVLGDADAKSGGGSDSYNYGAGAKLDGEQGRAIVSVGGLREETGIQLVHKVGCTPARPRCAAGSIPLKDYGIQGDGLPGEGFKAILGVNMANAEVPSLFSSIGARRWIIDLPRPGDDAPGRILLNPTDEEAAGYAMLPIAQRFADQRGGLHDGVSGCLVNDATRAKVCGVVLFDTGAPGVRITGDSSAAGWPEDAPVTLLLADDRGTVKAVERIRLGQRDQASRLSIDREGGPPIPAIFLGLTPYFAFSVLYDPAHGMIGVKPRAPAPGGPEGSLK